MKQLKVYVDVMNKQNEWVEWDYATIECNSFDEAKIYAEQKMTLPNHQNRITIKEMFTQISSVCKTCKTYYI